MAEEIKHEHYGVSLRLHLNEKQFIQTQKTFGCKRFFYNKLLDKRSKSWKRRNESINFTSQKAFLKK